MEHPPLDPWKRSSPKLSSSSSMRGYVYKKHHFGKFDEYVDKNRGLDITTKAAALKASPFVVSLTSYIGIQQLFMCSGIILNSTGYNDNFSTSILTSASLLKCPNHDNAIAENIKVDVYAADGSLYEGQIAGYDFHYNIAEITIKTTTPLQSAIIGNIDGSSTDSRSGRLFRLVPHRDTTINLSPDMKVIALGRYHNHPYHIMAAPGALRFVDSNLDCEELLMSNCEITKNGIGGPIISSSGFVLGMNFYKDPLTPFLPINIALKCLEHLQKYREVPRPWLGAKLSDLHIASLGELEILNQTFPLLLEGVVVRQMEPESPALRAGLCTGDVIVQFDGSTISKTLQFQSLLLDNANKPVDVVVKRAGTIAPLTLSLLPQRSRQVNRWPIPKEFSYQPNH